MNEDRIVPITTGISKISFDNITSVVFGRTLGYFWAVGAELTYAAIVGQT